MTTRKLTPAEALECLRDWYDDDMSCTDWRNKWSHVWPGWEPVVAIGRECLSAIEEDLALAQKPTAAPVKRGRCRIRQLLGDALNDGDKEATAMLQQALLWRMRQPAASEKPAAPVPSDEEIVKQLSWAMAAERHSATCTLVEMLARRIGVQGVPQ